MPEALEKLAKGMQILMREGSVSKDLHALAPIITERHSPFIAFCTDDRNPLDIAEEGHLDFIIRTAIQSGRAAARRLSRREHFGRAHLRLAGSRPRRAGLARRSRRARRSRILRGVARRDRRADRRRRAVRRARRSIAPVGRHSVKARRVSASDFVARGQGPSTQAIGVVPGKIITERVPAMLPFANGLRGDRSRPGFRQGRGRRAPRRQRQHRHRLRARLRHEARRHRLFGRPRQPQHHRRRRRRGGYGGRGQSPASRSRAASWSPKAGASSPNSRCPSPG